MTGRTSWGDCTAAAGLEVAATPPAVAVTATSLVATEHDAANASDTTSATIVRRRCTAGDTISAKRSVARTEVRATRTDCGLFVVS